MKRSREAETEQSSSESDDLEPASREASLPASKIVGLDPSEDSSTPSVEMKCSLPPHKETLVFATYEEFETHYNKAHTNRCLDCRKIFPSQHLLDLHHEECHDAFAALRREKGEQTVRFSSPLLSSVLVVMMA
jgi:hypothetical protein